MSKATVTGGLWAGSDVRNPATQRNMIDAKLVGDDDDDVDDYDDIEVRIYVYRQI